MLQFQALTEPDSGLGDTDFNGRFGEFSKAYWKKRKLIDTGFCLVFKDRLAELVSHRIWIRICFNQSTSGSKIVLLQ